MMRNTLLLIVGIIALTSCVREEIPPCPPLQIWLGIEDRNYDNIDEVAAEGLDTKRGDNDSFRSFVGTLYYVVEEYESHEIIVEQHVTPVSGDELQVACEGIPEELPFGRYIVTVWGNLPGEGTLQQAGGLRASTLHPEQVEGVDLYMACDTLDYTYDHGTHRVGLNRVKGKLLIEVRNLPAEVRWSNKIIDRVAGCVDTRLNYSGVTAVKTQYAWNGEPYIVTDTYVAPSAEGDYSRLAVNFYDDGTRTSPVCTPEEVKLPLLRNHITVVRYDYEASTGEFDAFILVDSRWENIHDLEID